MERLPSRRSFCLLKVYTKSKSRTILKKITKKGKAKEERRTTKEERRKKNNNDVVTRATNAARVRPEDDSTYVTTLFELTGFEFLSSKVDRRKCQKCQLEVRNVSWT